MTDEPTEDQIEAFDRLVHQAAELHEFAWCAKTGWFRFTASLRGRECLRCEAFCMNGGVCDPL